MHATDIFTLGPATDEDGQSTLFARGIRIANFPARCIEAQFGTGDHYILFTSLDSPYEEELNVQLFNSRFKRIHRLVLGAPLTPGIFALEGVDQSCIYFRFPSWQQHRLRIRSGALLHGRRLHLEAWSEPAEGPPHLTTASRQILPGISFRRH